MRFSLAIALAAAGFTAAQSTTAPATGGSSTGVACAAQYILDVCLSTEKPKVEACTGNDWKCMCEGQQSVLTCYNNCPDDVGRPSAQNQLTAWCNAAGIVSSTVSAVSAATTTASTKTTGSSTSTSAQTQASKAAANMYAPGSGLLAVAVGVAGLL